jgi:hypothetical protein
MKRLLWVCLVPCAGTVDRWGQTEPHSPVKNRTLNNGNLTICTMLLLRIGNMMPLRQDLEAIANSLSEI